MLRIFGPKRDEATREWRKLHNVELTDLYSSSNIFLGNQIEKNEMGGKCSMYGERRGAYRILVGKHEGRTSRHRWEHNLKKWDVGART